MVRFIQFLIVSIIIASSASADSPPISSSPAGPDCVKLLMCNGQGSAGDCTDPSTSDEVVADVTGYTRMTFYAHLSSATTFTCNPVHSDRGHDIGVGNGDTATAIAITDSTPAPTASVNWNKMWITCSTISGGTVIVNVLACRD